MCGGASGPALGALPDDTDGWAVVAGLLLFFVAFPMFAARRAIVGWLFGGDAPDDDDLELD